MSVIRTLVVSTLFVYAATPALAESRNYFCVAEHSAGMTSDDGNWKSSRFNVSDQRYIIRPVSPNSGDSTSTHAVYRMQGNVFMLYCQDTSADSGMLFSCGSRIWNFLVANGSLRFQSYYGFGYLDDANDDPHLTIGTCSPLE